MCALIIAAGLGLAAIMYSQAGADVADFQKTQMLAQTAEPTARSNFDVYLEGRELRYFKQPCDKNDVKPSFFLGAFPANIEDISRDRWQAGFDNLDFKFYAERGYIIDNACAVRVRLPDYEIEKISTGQYIQDEAGIVANLWIVEFPVAAREPPP